MESAFLLTMSVENIVEQYLNEGLTEEYKVLMNVLMDKLELGEITFNEYQEFSVNLRLLELRKRLAKEELSSIKFLEYKKTVPMLLQLEKEDVCGGEVRSSLAALSAIPV